MRAAAQNPASSRLVGIRVGWMLALGWGLAGGDRRDRRHDGRADRVPRPEHDGGHPALRVSPRRWSAASTIPGGAVLGGFIVGVLENVLGAYVIGNELKLAVALVLIIGVLVVRPSGLFGKVHVTRV